MLIEAWEHLCGYNKWTLAKAIVQASSVSEIEFGKNDAKQPVAWRSVCTIGWQDQNRVAHSAEFEVFEESPLYQLCEGDKVDIRFNTRKPDQYYLPGLIQSRLAKTWKLTMFGALFVLVLIGIAVAWFGPNILGAFSH